MPDDVFQKHVTALAVKRLEKPKKLSVQNARYWTEIVNQLYNFHRGIWFSHQWKVIYRALTIINFELS